MKRHSYQKHFFWWISIIVFLCIVANLLLYYGLIVLDQQIKFINIEQSSPIITLSIFLGVSFALSAGTAFVVARLLSKPIEDLKKATTEIAKGNFDVQIPQVKNKTINEIIDNFNTMTHELKSIETLKADFISNVSHEFKTPLSVIQSYTKALSKPDLPPETRKTYEEVIDKNIKKLTNLTTNILTLSKIENSKINVEKTTFSLDEQIRQAILLQESKWKDKNLELDINLPPVTINAPKNLLEQVWQNLLDNAIKFSHPNGKIFISLEELPEKITVEIQDQGIGISQDKLSHIFDKFYQADTSHSSSGNGLGLALVKRILDTSGAEILVESQVEKGTTFKIIFKK